MGGARNGLALFLPRTTPEPVFLELLSRQPRRYSPNLQYHSQSWIQ